MHPMLKTSLKFLAVSLLVTLTSLPVFASNRVLQITAPKSVEAGATAHAKIVVSTDAGKSEQIGFLQVEYSVDGGETWTVLCYDQDVGAQASREVDVTVGASGVETIVRARAAFRGGVAGDVDFDGKSIKWDTSWENWANPPARQAVIVVK
jgi:hypothetical protein